MGLGLMPFYRLGDVEPALERGAWAAPSADLIGDVRLGARASVWFGAGGRADNTPNVLGEETNHALADRSGRAEHERLHRTEIEVPTRGADGRGGSGVRAG